MTSECTVYRYKAIRNYLSCFYYMEVLLVQRYSAGARCAGIFCVMRLLVKGVETTFFLIQHNFFLTTVITLFFIYLRTE